MSRTSWMRNVQMTNIRNYYWLRRQTKWRRTRALNHKKQKCMRPRHFGQSCTYRQSRTTRNKYLTQTWSYASQLHLCWQRRSHVIRVVKDKASASNFEAALAKRFVLINQLYRLRAAVNTDKGNVNPTEVQGWNFFFYYSYAKYSKRQFSVNAFFFFCFF